MLEVGTKALELGGNAVLAYKQFFDVEGDSGLVARACGTACFIIPVKSVSSEEEGIDAEDTSMLGTTDNLPSERFEMRSPQAKKRHLRTPKASAAEPIHISMQDDVQLITLKSFDASTRIQLGGITSARSVKYLGKLATKLADQETRDSWWLELRDEVHHEFTFSKAYSLS